MQSQTHLRLPTIIRLAQAINRMLTWGMPPDERAGFLSETVADWEAMAGDRRPVQLLWRALRGIPAAIWMRLDRRAITAMPAGVAMIMVGLGALAASVQEGILPSPFQEFAAATAAGMLLIGINFVREPRRIKLRRYRLAAVVAGLENVRSRGDTVVPCDPGAGFA